MTAIRADRAYPLADYHGRPPAAPSWFKRAVATLPEVGEVLHDGARIETLSWGDRGKPGLLLLHGAMAHAGWWSHIAPALATARRVTALSWSGMGGSDWRSTYSAGQHAREALAVAEQTGLFDAPTLPTAIGHSFGGHALLKLACTDGPRFQRAVVLDSAAGSPSHPPKHPVRPAEFSSLEDALARFRLLPGQKAEPYILDRLARGGLKSTTTAEGEARFTWSFDPALFVNYEPVDDQAWLSAALCPLVFMRGDRSAVATPAVEAGQRAKAPKNTEFVTLPNAAHHLMADQPQILTQALLDLLGRDDAASSALSLGADAYPVLQPPSAERCS